MRKIIDAKKQIFCFDYKAEITSWTSQDKPTKKLNEKLPKKVLRLYFKSVQN